MARLRWVIRYAPAIAAKAHSQKRNTNGSWRMFKSHHWFSYFFDKSMVLFDNIIQIFNLAYVDHSGKPSQN
jgi:hypothetical protein